MENRAAFGLHPPEERFEEYRFGRLTEEESATFEEHLLICDRCCEQLKKTDEYVVLMKRGAAVASASEFPVPLWRRMWLPAAVGAGVVALGLLVTIPLREPAGRVIPVQLGSFRGGDTAIAETPAGNGVELRVDCTDLDSREGLRLEIVDSAGRRVWSGAGVAAEPNLIRAQVTEKLKAGVYWVRLYSASGELLREFGLRAG